MVLTSGTRLGSYEILSALGAGSMGEVYRARDTALNRNVAIKVLAESVAHDPDRLARFEREAQTLASLSHPNIAQIHGMEQAGGLRGLVMELVEGEDLSERIARGTIPLEEAFSIARQIAEAVAGAHEQGIIHRDLKPANIKIRSDGVVKVLDFGLAKALEPLFASDAAAALARSPTITSPAALTGIGMMLGTAAYMSPEQARGSAASRRSDVWAFGVVLYEMLTRQRPFPGDRVPETLASILTREPDWTLLPAATPSSIRRLLRRCLEKDPARRLADMADARLDVDDALSVRETGAHPAVPTSPTRRLLAWALLVVVGLTVAVMMAQVWRRAPVPASTTRTLLSVPPGTQASAANPLEQRAEAVRPTRTAVALSPDGKTLVFGAIWGSSEQLYSRAMDQLNATPMPDTTGGSSPFFSPDGQWVGFWAAGEIRKVPLSGGPAVTLCKSASLFGASWGSNGNIVFAPSRNGGLWRVASAGGTADPLTTLGPGEFSHRLPHLLPGGHAVLFTISKGARRWDDTDVVVRSLDTGVQTRLITGGADARYVPTGHLVYTRLGTLMAVPFDLDRLEVTGGATGLIQDVMQSADRNRSDMANTLAAQLTFSTTGALVYLTGGVVPGAQRLLAWADRKGTRQDLPAPPDTYRTPRLSADGQQVAVTTEHDVRDVWRYDIARGALSPVTIDGHSGYGMFAADGRRVLFRSGAAGGEDNLYWKAADGSGAAERLTTSARSQTPSSWSPDGATLAFVQEGESRSGRLQFDIWVLSVADGKTRAVVETLANEMSPEFSPDGHWLAYVSNESGRHEVYVQPYPGPGERHPISIDGGFQPAWNHNGRELFYAQSAVGDSGVLKLVSVPIVTAPAFRAGTPTTLFESTDLAIGWGRNYDVAPNGLKFLMTLTKPVSTQPAPPQMIFVQNWFDELKRLVPTK